MRPVPSSGLGSGRLNLSERTDSELPTDEGGCPFDGEGRRARGHRGHSLTITPQVRSTGPFAGARGTNGTSDLLLRSAC